MLLIIWKQKKTLLHKSAKFLRFLLILMIWIISNIPLCWDFRNAICNCFLVSNKRTAVTTEHPNILKNFFKKTSKWQFLKQLPTYVSNMLLSKSLSDIVHLDPPLFFRRPFGGRFTAWQTCVMGVTCIYNKTENGSSKELKADSTKYPDKTQNPGKRLPKHQMSCNGV